jgi:hypothetical protein
MDDFWEILKMDIYLFKYCGINKYSGFELLNTERLIPERSIIMGAVGAIAGKVVGGKLLGGVLGKAAGGGLLGKLGGGSIFSKVLGGVLGKKGEKAEKPPNPLKMLLSLINGAKG